MEKVRIRKHKRAFICSPLRPRGATAGQRADDLRHNRQLAQLGCRYAVSLGYLPMAPHLFFPEFLSEDKPEEREEGIQFGLEWLSECDELWVIGSRITEGMKREIAVARELGIPIKQHIPVLVLEGELLDEFFGRKDTEYDPGYEEDDWNPNDDDEEEGLIYDGD